MQHEKTPDSGQVQEFLNTPEPRRDFVTQAAAVVTGAALGVVPLVAGLGVFLDPLRKREATKGDAGADAEGFLKVASIDGLAVGSTPKRFEVIGDRTDAWNFFPREAIGAVYLLRPSDGEVRAFNVQCPHAGCSVDYKPAAACYQCPCHDSSFRGDDGKVLNPSSPSPRGLDELEARIVDGFVWVKYQEFRPGTSHKEVKA